MSNYSKSTDFASKDTLSSGDPNKIVKGTEIDAEFEAIETAVNSKINTTDIGTTVQAYDADLTTLGAGGAGARSFLGLVIGTNVQAWDADLDTWAGKTAPSGTVVGTTDTQTLTNKTINGGALQSGTAVASTSGTSIDFTSIPSWVKRITVMFSGVSTSGTSLIQVQIGAGSVVTTGYISNAYYPNGPSTSGLITSGFVQTATIISAASTQQGFSTFVNFGSNIWICNGLVTDDAGRTNYNAGSKTLSGTLDRIRITTVNGTDTFDAGSINILYE